MHFFKLILFVFINTMENDSFISLSKHRNSRFLPKCLDLPHVIHGHSKKTLKKFYIYFINLYPGVKPYKGKWKQLTKNDPNLISMVLKEYKLTVRNLLQVYPDKCIFYTDQANKVTKYKHEKYFSDGEEEFSDEEE